MDKDEWESVRNLTKGLSIEAWDIWDYDNQRVNIGALEWYKYNLKKLYERVMKNNG